MRRYPRSKTMTAMQKQNKLASTRNLVAQRPTTSLAELAAHARKPLEHALENSSSPQGSTKELVIFFSFTNTLERATVVQFKGNSLDEVWKKFFDWQQRKFKKSPQASWLRIDWVTAKFPMEWGECLEKIQIVKRNYFRYGVALDTGLKHAFLEQEINANAMLYLGAKEPKAKFNKKNFEHYGTQRYGKHFKLPPSHQEQALLFTTQALFVDQDGSNALLYGYSGGVEGRNTGRRIIEKLDSPQVESLIAQSSQFLAQQVNADGRFIYGIHPCFDREINTYNTLRHTSTTYSMLEAWEVTQSSELKSAIDRSINYLVNDLIRTYTLSDGTQLAYLQDTNKEVKLGGNAVCLLALVKYTELTNDQQYATLLEQLAAGIQHMQNAETGQFNHVLNADDLSIKEAFRIIYYDGEAAFGLMRLYGLTKDERWINTVEKAFEYFIEKEHWKIHDHWLSYCVNELTLYRPEKRYYQFGIKNVADHLDFVIGRITTFPTLLELMMAAHKMITRLQQSEEHSHLLDELNINKFYKALDARAHYLLNGFFWPEMAMYFQNPQRIVGSFFIRHHSFRVRIDDVEHYLSGYVAYLLHYLSSAPEKQHEKTITYKTNTEKNTAKEVAALFLNQDIGGSLTGIEHSSLGRASLFIEELGINPVIVTFQYRPYLQYNVQQILSKKRYHPSTRVIGLYDFIQGFQDLLGDRASKNVPPALDPSFPELTAIPVKGFKDIRYLDERGQLFAYKVYSKTHGQLIHINYFENGKKIAADIFHTTGYKSSHRLYNSDKKKTTHEIYYNPWGVPLFFRVFDRLETHTSKPDNLNIGFHLLPPLSEEQRPHLINETKPKQPLTSSAIGINALNQVAKKSHYIGNEAAFSSYALKEFISKFQQKHILLLCDKNKFTFKPAAQLRGTNQSQHTGKKIRIISVIHSTHYQGQEIYSNIKNHYQSLLQSSEKADKIIVLTQSQLEDIQKRFPNEKLATIPHTLPKYPPPHNHASSPLLQSGKIVYVARLSPEKNHLLALEIFEQLIKKLPKAKLHFYGEGNERSTIEKRISELHLGNNVVLEGYCTDVGHIYQDADCAILTSKMEGFSLSLIEAMAFKCPTVAFDINYGPRDLISHGETGFLVPYSDQGMFVQYLFNILTQPKLADDLGWQAYKCFTQNFSHKLIAERWQEVIADILF